MLIKKTTIKIMSGLPTRSKRAGFGAENVIVLVTFTLSNELEGVDRVREESLGKAKPVHRLALYKRIASRFAAPVHRIDDSLLQRSLALEIDSETPLGRLGGEP